MNTIRRVNSGLDFPTMRDKLFFPFEQSFDKIVREFFSDSIKDSIKSTGNYPKIDVHQDDEYWMVRAAVPGVTVDDIMVEVSESPSGDSYLSISGQMHSTYRNEREPSKMAYKELYMSKFRRDISLPNYVSGEPDAELRDGILTLKWKHNLKTNNLDRKSVKIRSG